MMTQAAQDQILEYAPRVMIVYSGKVVKIGNFLNHEVLVVSKMGVVETTH
jgi:hypothetical protein